MDKPFSMICEEFKQNLASLINNCSLPLPVIEAVLQNYLMEVNAAAKNQYHLDKIKYEKFLSEQKDKELKNEEEKD